jgi:hypothetical protein
MDRKQPSVIREGVDGGVIGCGEIGSKYYVQQGSQNTTLWDT